MVLRVHSRGRRALHRVQVNGSRGCDLTQGCAHSALSAPSGCAAEPGGVLGPTEYKCQPKSSRESRNSAFFSPLN